MFLCISDDSDEYKTCLRWFKSHLKTGFIGSTHIKFAQDRINHNTSTVTPLCTRLVWPWGSACSPATSNTAPSSAINSQFAGLKPLSRCVSAGSHGLMWTSVGHGQHTETAGLCKPKRRAVVPAWKPRAGRGEDELSSSSWFLAAESCQHKQTDCLHVTQSKVPLDSF